MSESQLKAYRLLIVPGGNFETISNNLSSSTTANVRRAVQGGSSYLGQVSRRNPSHRRRNVGKRMGDLLLSGVHAEAPASWRHGMTFTTPASVDNAYAATLIHAALDRTWLPHD
jgi:hypothetical protein